MQTKNWRIGFTGWEKHPDDGPWAGALIIIARPLTPHWRALVICLRSRFPWLCLRTV
jgi:hypothetical protein